MHDIDEKEVRKLLLPYKDIVTNLKDIGITQSSNVVSGYGEYVVCKKFD